MAERAEESSSLFCDVASSSANTPYSASAATATKKVRSTTEGRRECGALEEGRDGPGLGTGSRDGGASGWGCHGGGGAERVRTCSVDVKLATLAAGELARQHDAAVKVDALVDRRAWAEIQLGVLTISDESAAIVCVAVTKPQG